MGIPGSPPERCSGLLPGGVRKLQYLGWKGGRVERWKGGKVEGWKGGKEAARMVGLGG